MLKLWTILAFTLDILYTSGIFVWITIFKWINLHPSCTSYIIQDWRSIIPEIIIDKDHTTYTQCKIFCNQSIRYCNKYTGCEYFIDKLVANWILNTCMKFITKIKNSFRTNELKIRLQSHLGNFFQKENINYQDFQNLTERSFYFINYAS